MDYKAPNLERLEPYFKDILSERRFQFEIPKSIPDSILNQMLIPYNIPEFLYDDILWLWGYFAIKYEPGTYENTLKELNEKHDFHSKSNVQSALNTFKYGHNLTEYFDWELEDIEKITITHKTHDAVKVKPDMVFDTSELIRYVCEAVQFYSEHHPNVLFGFKQLAQENQDYLWRMRKTKKEAKQHKEDFNLSFKKADAHRLFFFLREFLPSDLSVRQIAKFGSFLMFKAGVKFPDADGYLGYRLVFEPEHCMKNFISWSYGDVNNPNAKVNIYAIPKVQNAIKSAEEMTKIESLKERIKPSLSSDNEMN